MRCTVQSSGDGLTFRLAAAVGSEMRGRPVVGCAASSSLLVRCHVDVRHQATLLPSGLSPTILLPLAVADKLLLLDVQAINYSLMCRSRLFLPDVLELAVSSCCIS